MFRTICAIISPGWNTQLSKFWQPKGRGNLWSPDSCPPSPILLSERWFRRNGSHPGHEADLENSGDKVKVPNEGEVTSSEGSEQAAYARTVGPPVKNSGSV